MKKNDLKKKYLKYNKMDSEIYGEENLGYDIDNVFYYCYELIDDDDYDMSGMVNIDWDDIDDDDYNMDYDYDNPYYSIYDYYLDYYPDYYNYIDDDYYDNKEREIDEGIDDIIEMYNYLIINKL